MALGAWSVAMTVRLDMGGLLEDRGGRHGSRRREVTKNRIRVVGRQIAEAPQPTGGHGLREGIQGKIIHGVYLRLVKAQLTARDAAFEERGATLDFIAVGVSILMLPARIHPHEADRLNVEAGLLVRLPRRGFGDRLAQVH